MVNGGVTLRIHFRPLKEKSKSIILYFRVCWDSLAFLPLTTLDMKVKGKILNPYSILNESIILRSPQIIDEANVTCFLF